MQNKISRWIFIFLLVTMIFSFPFGGVQAASEQQIPEDPSPSSQSDTVIKAKTSLALYLIIGAFVIVLVIMGGVFFRRTKT